MGEPAVRTLHLTNSWHETSGGIATFYKALIAEADRRGHEFRLVVPGAEDRVEEPGPFTRIYHVKSPPSLFNSSYRTIYPTQFLGPGSKVQRILAAERPQLVEISDKYTLNYLGAVLRMKLLTNLDFRPVVIGLSSERMDDNFKTYVRGFPFARKFCSLYMNWLYFPFCDHHIANSEYTAEELRCAAQGQLVARGTWIRPMGVDLSCFSPQRKSPDARLRLLRDSGASENSVLLLYVGRLVPEKNLPLLFEVLADLTKGERDSRLLVVGDGIEAARWQQHCAKELPGRARFLGHIKDKNILADIYANADVFVHPNPREPFGIAPLEAMASGLALVAPNEGGVTSYANPENAWTTNPDVRSFVQAVQEIVGNPAQASRKIEKAVAAAQEYRWENIASSFLDLYAELTRLRQPAYEMKLAPDFYSTPASGTQAASIHYVSQFAERAFRFASAMGSSARRGEC